MDTERRVVYSDETGVRNIFPGRRFRKPGKISAPSFIKKNNPFPHFPAHTNPVLFKKISQCTLWYGSNLFSSDLSAIKRDKCRYTHHTVSLR